MARRSTTSEAPGDGGCGLTNGAQLADERRAGRRRVRPQERRAACLRAPRGARDVVAAGLVRSSLTSAALGRARSKPSCSDKQADQHRGVRRPWRSYFFACGESEWIREETKRAAGLFHEARMGAFSGSRQTSPILQPRQVFAAML